MIDPRFISNRVFYAPCHVLILPNEVRFCTGVCKKSRAGKPAREGQQRSAEQPVQAAVAAEEHEDLDSDGGHRLPPQMWMKTKASFSASNILLSFVTAEVDPRQK